MDKPFIVCATGKSGREFMPREFDNLADARAHFNLPGIAFGTVYRNYIGGTIEYTTYADFLD